MRTPDSSAANHTVYSCAESGCRKLALQVCTRCQRHFCNDHAEPVERDLPTRGLKLPEPYWYCADCLPYYR
jgi:hypothetical protein